MERKRKEKKLKCVHLGDVKAIAERFGTSAQTVRNALMLFTNSELSRQIREAARELGAVEYED